MTLGSQEGVAISKSEGGRRSSTDHRELSQVWDTRDLAAITGGGSPCQHCYWRSPGHRGYPRPFYCPSGLAAVWGAAALGWAAASHGHHFLCTSYPVALTWNWEVRAPVRCAPGTAPQEASDLAGVCARPQTLLAAWARALEAGAALAQL